MDKIAGFANLAYEVKFGHTTEEQAQARIQEHVREQVEWQVAAFLDLEIGLHPSHLVQYWADKVRLDPGRVAEVMIVRLLGEYSMLRRRLEDARIQVAAARMSPPQLPPQLHLVKEQLFGALREIDKAQDSNGPK